MALGCARHPNVDGIATGAESILAVASDKTALSEQFDYGDKEIVPGPLGPILSL